jgi:hypothetical protein
MTLNRCDEPDRQNRALVGKINLKALQKRREQDLRFGHGETGADADPGAAAERNEGAVRPWLRLSFETLWEEGVWMIPMVAMTVQRPRGYPDEVPRLDTFS